MNLEVMTEKSISGWIGQNADGTPSRLRLFLNDQELGDFVADGYRKDIEKVTGTGRGIFKIGLGLDKEQYLNHLPRNATLRLVDLETGNQIGELPISGQSDRPRFENEFGEAFSYYQKGEGFIVPLSSRTEEWWEAVRQAMDTVFAKAKAAGIEVQIAYGALLGHVREGGFIPHDDDVDLILHCGEQDGPISAALEFARLLEIIHGDGQVKRASNGQAHIHFDLQRRVSLDVFAAWSAGGRYFQNFTISGGIPDTDVFPSKSAVFMGTEVLIPQTPENVLSAIYGPDWMHPNPQFKWGRPKEVSDFFSPIHDYQSGANKGYWNSYYGAQSSKNAEKKSPPSQFAAFAVDFIDRDDLIVEFGCGNARDSLFFSSYGWNVLASDYSDAAIKANRETARAQGNDRVRFAVCNVAETESMQKFLDQCQPHQTGKRAFYSRFFLHAISTNAERNMRLMIDRYARPGDLVVFETRVAGDENRPKVTPAHFRRFVNGENTIKAWEALGWQRDYTVSGTGFAKYKTDDALVCRFVLSKKG